MPALMGAVGGTGAGAGLGIIPEHSLLDSCTRLSISLEESVFKVTAVFIAFSFIEIVSFLLKNVLDNIPCFSYYM